MISEMNRGCPRNPGCIHPLTQIKHNWGKEVPFTLDQTDIGEPSWADVSRQY